MKCKTGLPGSFVPFLLIPPVTPKESEKLYEIKAGASCENLTSYWYYVVLEPRNAKLAWQVASFHCDYPSDQNQVWHKECCLKMFPNRLIRIRGDYQDPAREPETGSSGSFLPLSFPATQEPAFSHCAVNLSDCKQQFTVRIRVEFLPLPFTRRVFFNKNENA